MKIYLPSTFTLRYVRAKMIVYAFMINRTIDMQEKSRIMKFMYKVKGKLFCCGTTDSGKVPSREGDIQNFS